MHARGIPSPKASNFSEVRPIIPALVLRTNRDSYIHFQFSTNAGPDKVGKFESQNFVGVEL